MFKNALKAVILLIFIFLIFFITLLNGILIDNLSFKNINIQGLYLKYDKKLFVEIQNLSVIDEKNNYQTTDMGIKLSIESFFDKYFINVSEYLLKEPYLKISGNIILDTKDINLENISKVYITNLNLLFHEKLKPIVADKCFVSYEDEIFNFSFHKPTYDNVELDNSKVQIVDFRRLELELISTDKLGSPLLFLLSNYKVELPLTQDYGQNKIKVRLSIPFYKKEKMFTYANINTKNGKIYLHKIPIYVKNLDIKLDNSMLYGSGILSKQNTEHNLSYDINQSFSIDFKENIVKGDFFINKGQFNELKMDHNNGSFLLNFDSNLTADIKLDKNSTLNIGKDRYYIKDFNTSYKNQKKSFFSNLNLLYKDIPINILINDTFNLKKLKSKGKFSIDYETNSTKNTINDIAYKANFSKKFYLDVNSSNNKGDFLGYKYNIDNIIGRYEDEIFKGKIDHLEANSTIKKIFSNNIDIKIDARDKTIANISTNDTKIKISKLKLPIKSTKIKYHDKNITLNNIIDTKNTKIEFDTLVELKEDRLHGLAQITHNQDKENINYFMNYKDDINFQAPKAKLKYISNEKSKTLSIKELNYFDKYFDYIHADKNSSIFVKKTQNDKYLLNINNVSVDINDTKAFFEAEENNSSEIYRINWFNSAIKLKKYTFEFDNLIFNGNSKNFDWTLNKDKTNISIRKFNNKLFLKSPNIQSSYLNTVFNNNSFKNGHIDLFITNNENNLYNGQINLNDVTVKDLKVVDNLLLFVNTTPALLNPFLAIPTLFRFTKNKFRLDGYHINNGTMKFYYDKNSDIVDIFNINTNGNINDFDGKIKLNFQNNKIDGEVKTIFLKDYAKVINNIPIINKIFLGKSGNFYIPVELYGQINDVKYRIKRDNNSSKKNTNDTNNTINKLINGNN